MSLQEIVEAQPVRPKRRWRRRIVFTLLGLVILALGGYGGVYWWAKSGRDAEIAKLRAAGEPVWFHELRPEPLDPKEDGTPLLREALAAMKPLPEDWERHLNDGLGDGDDFGELIGFWESENEDGDNAVWNLDLEIDWDDEGGAKEEPDDAVDVAFDDVPEGADDATDGWDAVDDEDRVVRATEPPVSRRELETRIVANLRPHVEANREAFEKLRLALDRPKIAFPVDYDGRVPALHSSSEFGELWGLGSLLTARWRIEMHEGRFADALRTIEDGMRLHRAIADQVDVGLPAIAITSNFGDRFSALLGPASLDDAGFDRIDAFLRQHESTCRCERALKINRSIALTSAENIGYVQNDEFGQPLEADRPRWVFKLGRPLVLANQYRLLQTMGPIIDYADRGDREAREARSAAFDFDREYAFFDKPTRILENLFLFGYDTLPNHTLNARHRLIASRIALRVDRFRDRNGHLPKSLSEITDEAMPTVPVDLHDGLAFGYRAMPDGFIVYPVGYDGKDSGGVNEEEDRKAWNELLDAAAAADIPAPMARLTEPDEVEWSGRIRVRYDR